MSSDVWHCPGEDRSCETAASVGSATHVSAPAVRVRNLSKCYPIYDKPRDRLKQFLLPRLHRLLGRAPKRYYRDFWALREVAFDIAKGETVGIIGRNGAGKSTLLQMICGTLSPTSGSVETNGRIAALLELGAGFNPEFTGTENVFLNSALLGLTRDEVEDRFDEIVAFADIGQFLDQPVKTYSSGMYVRLAFAVQACVDPEILVVDEALSVGDIGFQYKCFKRMERLRANGATILMVTHSTSSVLEYADRCIVLESGRILDDTTDVLAAVLAYEKDMLSIKVPVPPVNRGSAERFTKEQLSNIREAHRNISIGEKRFGTARAIIESMTIVATVAGEERCTIRSGDEMEFRFGIRSTESIPEVVLGVSISRAQGGDVWGDNNLNAGVPMDLAPGVTNIAYRVKLPVSAGEYLVHCGLATLAAGEREELDQRRPVAILRIWSPRAQVGVVFAPIEVDQLGSAEH